MTDNTAPQLRLAGYGVTYAQFTPSDHVHFSAVTAGQAVPDFPENAAPIHAASTGYLLAALLILAAAAGVQSLILRGLNVGGPR